MKKTSRIDPEKVEINAELIQDEALIGNENHICLKAFKDRSWNLVRKKTMLENFFLSIGLYFE